MNVHVEVYDRGRMTCPENDECDGRMHRTAVWNDEVGRWVPVDFLCPLRGQAS